MSWDSLTALREEFGISPDVVDRDQLRAELRRQLAALHPDKTGGSFSTAEQESRFHRLSEALTYLDGDLPVPVVLHAMTAKLAVIENHLAALQSLGGRGDRSVMGSDASEGVQKQVAEAYRMPRIGSAAFAAICGAIIAFSKMLDGNPVFGAIGASRAAVIALLSAFIASGAIFVLTWMKERRSAELVQWLLTDDGLASVARNCLYPRDGSKEPRLSITKREMVDHIAWIDHVWHKSAVVLRLKQLLFAAPVSRNVAGRVADMQLSELLARGIVRPSGLRGVEPLFAIDAQRAKEIIESDAGSVFRMERF